MWEGKASRIGEHPGSQQRSGIECILGGAGRWPALQHTQEEHSGLGGDVSRFIFAFRTCISALSTHLY